MELVENIFNSVWNKIIDWIKDPWILVLVFLVSSLMIFLPEEYIKLLKLNELVNQHGWIIGILFVISGIGLFIFVISKIIDWINKKIYYHNKKNRLKNLSIEEKKVLHRFIHFQERTINFSLIDNNIIKELSNQGLVRITIAGSVDPFECPFTIKEWVYKYLNKNKHLLKISEEESQNMGRREETRQDIRNRY